MGEGMGDDKMSNFTPHEINHAISSLHNWWDGSRGKECIWGTPEFDELVDGLFKSGELPRRGDADTVQKSAILYAMRILYEMCNNGMANAEGEFSEPKMNIENPFKHGYFYVAMVVWLNRWGREHGYDGELGDDVIYEPKYALNWLIGFYKTEPIPKEKWW